MIECDKRTMKELEKTTIMSERIGRFEAVSIID